MYNCVINQHNYCRVNNVNINAGCSKEITLLSILSLNVMLRRYGCYDLGPAADKR